MTRQLVPDRRLRTEAHGSVLMGGHPFRIMRLSRTGAATVRSWFRGEAVPATESPERELADRLLDAGLAHPVPSPSTRPVHVVIPFHGAIDDLDRTVQSLVDQRTASITIVDDGNPVPVGERDGMVVLRHESSRGPAAARNTGWRHALAAVDDGHDDAVAFVDAGVTLDPGLITSLSGHLDDDGVGAAAPRVLSSPGSSAIARYEVLHSPLDLGPDPSPVGPNRPVTYVPTACLVVRASLLSALDGFDEQLRYGEDVDFVWRASVAAVVRYEPAVIAHHRPRASTAAFAQQRFRYASAAAGLARRHPGAAAPWRSTSIGVAGVAAVSAGHPLLGLLVGLVPVPRYARLLSATATPLPTAVRLASVGHGWALRSFAEAVVRTWAVPAGGLAVGSPLASRMRVWFALGWARRFFDTTDPTVVLLGVVDDTAYGVGVMAGVMRARSFRGLRALLPAIGFRYDRPRSTH